MLGIYYLFPGIITICAPPMQDLDYLKKFGMAFRDLDNLNFPDKSEHIVKGFRPNAQFRETSAEILLVCTYLDVTLPIVYQDFIEAAQFALKYNVLVNYISLRTDQ